MSATPDTLLTAAGVRRAFIDFFSANGHHHEASGSLIDGEKMRVFARLSTRINKEGVLQVHSERHRSQEMNRTAAECRLGELLGEALEETRPRRRTKVPGGSRKRRREDKQRRSRLKQTRSPRSRADVDE